MKRPELPENPLPCPFCGNAPVVRWNGAMTIACHTAGCCRPRTEWWGDASKCVSQWNSRAASNAAAEAEVERLREQVAKARNVLGVIYDFSCFAQDIGRGQLFPPSVTADIVAVLAALDTDDNVARNALAGADTEI